MDSFPYNGKPLNSAGGLASIVYLPASSTGMGFLLYERASALLSGSITKEVTLVGDISKIALIGSANVTFSVTATGDLTRYRTAYFNAETVSVGFTPAGTLTKLSLFPVSGIGITTAITGQLTRIIPMQGDTGIAVDLIGSLIRTQYLGDSQLSLTMDLSGVLGAIQYLSGDVNVDIVPSGDMSIFSRNYIGYASTSMSFAVSGTLLQTVMLAGSTSMSMDIDGTMSRTIFIAGESVTQFDVNGLLSNNATVADLDGFLMVRRQSNREMTR